MPDQPKTIDEVGLPEYVDCHCNNPRRPTFLKVPYFKNGDKVTVSLKVNDGTATDVYCYTWADVPDLPDAYGMLALDMVPKVIDLTPSPGEE